MTKPSLIKEMRSILLDLSLNRIENTLARHKRVDKVLLAILKFQKGMLGVELPHIKTLSKEDTEINSYYANGHNAYRASLLKIIEDAEKMIDYDPDK